MYGTRLRSSVLRDYFSLLANNSRLITEQFIRGTTEVFLEAAGNSTKVATKVG